MIHVRAHMITRAYTKSLLVQRTRRVIKHTALVITIDHTCSGSPKPFHPGETKSADIFTITATVCLFIQF
ncbi:MAG: hypothetical protein JXB88_08870 [Spirochaetales bacterium]|nr:hypothetical protein [Spirochaetales bacterium]